MKIDIEELKQFVTKQKEYLDGLDSDTPFREGRFNGVEGVIEDLEIWISRKERT